MKAKKYNPDLLPAVAERATRQRRKGKHYRLPLAEDDLPPVEVIKPDGTRVQGDRHLQYSVMQSNKVSAWLRVCAALDALATEADVQANPVAAEFVSVVRELAGSAATADSAAEAFDPIDALLPNGAVGVRSRVTQANRRKGKPGTIEQIDKQGVDRNHDIKRMHARLVEAGHNDATSQVAAAFKLSTRTIRRILGS
jgi:glutaminase